MGKQTKKHLKDKFDDGKKPNGDDFHDLIDSFVHQKDNKVFVDDQGFVGVGTESPQNQLDVSGSAAIGKNYSGNRTAPENGLIIEGDVGIGSGDPNEKLTVDGVVSLKELNESPGVTSGYGKLYVKEEKLVSTVFDGESSYVSMPKLGYPDIRDFTISTWFLLTQPVRDWRSFLADMRMDQGGGASCYLTVWDGGNQNCALEHGYNWRTGDHVSIYGEVGSIYHDWHHTAFVRENDKLKIYFDGKLLSDELYYGSMKDDSIEWDYPWRVGARSGELITIFGQVDELGLWKKPLKSEEIKNIFLGGRSLNLKEYYGDQMVSYWRMGDGKT